MGTLPTRIRTKSRADPSGGVIWDVVNRAGAIVGRVVVPLGEEIVGFAPDGFVFRTVKDGGQVHLQKVRAR